MKFIYILIKLVIYAFITYIATTYWRGLGWWFLVFCAILLIIVETLINKRIEHIQTQQFFKRYPILKDLKQGQTISIELKSGEELTDLIYIDFVDSEILVSKLPAFNSESKKVVENIVDTRWIKVKKIKTINYL